MDTIFIYGPPGSGKSMVGKLVAQALDRAFVDLDEVIADRAGMNIPQIFEQEGESAFRAREMEALLAVAGQTGLPGVVALGGGALLSEAARRAAQANGRVLCLRASPGRLLERLKLQHGSRPLLAGDVEALEQRLGTLLETRRAHYASFDLQIETDDLGPEQVAWQVLVALGRFHIRGMGSGYDVVVQPGILKQVGSLLLQRGLKGPVALVCDEIVADLYAEKVAACVSEAGYQVHTVAIPPGEAYKTIETITRLWSGFARAGLERGSTIIALGGGVVGDLTGFAASSFLRGVKWINIPTTLLSMVDSSLGGKTGFDLPEGKNLVGAFYPPRLVLADPFVLQTLPPRELRGGLAETIKHGVIGDPALFEWCEQGEAGALTDLDSLVRRAMAVKVRVIEEDPYEKGLRQALNLGHTVGHGIELASGFSLSHGESVAVGMAVETRLAEALGVAEPGLAARICAALKGLNLPVDIPAGLPRDRVVDAMGMDKKRAAGTVRFALPQRIGAVRVGVEVAGWQSKIFEL